MKQLLLTAQQIADQNFLLFKQNQYPGRVIVVGMDDKGNFIQGYAIMGRRPSSRNRLFVLNPKTGEVKADPLDDKEKETAENSELIFYSAMTQRDGCFAVTNGAQTHDALESAFFPYGMANPVFRKEWIYEPDGPNFTPRISATINLEKKEPQVELAIARKSLFSDACDHELHRVNLTPGLGYTIQTYDGNGDPLPSFSSRPYLLPLKGNHIGIAHTMWTALNEENRVAIAVKTINPQTGNWAVEIINKYSKVV